MQKTSKMAAAYPRSDGDGVQWSAEDVVGASSAKSMDRRFTTPGGTRCSQPRLIRVASAKLRPDLPNLIQHLMGEYFSQDENLQQFLKDVDGIIAG